MNLPLLVSNVCKRFPGKTESETIDAVKKVSFRVSPSECFGLLGPNGAGKVFFSITHRLILRQRSSILLLGCPDPPQGELTLEVLKLQMMRQGETAGTKWDCVHSMTFFMTI